MEKVVDSDSFFNGEPLIISNLRAHGGDSFLSQFTHYFVRKIDKIVLLPVVNYLRPITPATNPSYIIIISISPSTRNIEVDNYLLKAIANKAGSTLSSQIERKLNNITKFISSLARNAEATRSMKSFLGTLMRELVPRHFYFQQSVLLWWSNSSQRYEVEFSSLGSSAAETIPRHELDSLSAFCLNSISETNVLFWPYHNPALASRLVQSKSFICAPIKNRATEDRPYGFLILIDKISPFAKNVNPRSSIVDYFDWEDEYVMRHTESMISMVIELMHSEERRKALADQIAHEMVMPANYIVGTTEELLYGIANDDPLDRPRERKHLSNILTFAQLQMALCNGIMMGLQDEAVPPCKKYEQPRFVDLNQLAKKVAILTFPFCQRQKVKNDNITVGRGLPRLYIDQTAFTQVFLNLLTNSIKYKGSLLYEQFQVKISCDSAAWHEMPDVVRMKFYGGWRSFSTLDKVRSMNRGYSITIEDWGVGVKYGYEWQIFQRHFRVPGIEKIEVRGAGLGLAIVRRIVADHFGAIWLDKRRDPTTIAIYLPAKLETPAYTLDPRWLGERET
ncbi:MAG: sensor histidine kinase [Hyphomicrobiaceae bacterium]